MVKQCSDKYKVRKYVEEKLGNIALTLLNPLLAVYESPDQIEWENLPQRFALKWNFGSGLNFIINDKTKVNPKYVTEQLYRWSKKNIWMQNAELQYKKVEKLLLVEEYLGVQGKLPEDYKVYCFNGKAKCCLVINGRESEKRVGAFFDREWNYLGKPHGYGYVYQEFDSIPSEPVCLHEMFTVAEILSKDFPFVRVDFYEVDGKLIFGEMTFTPAGCIDVQQIEIDGKDMGEILMLE